MYDIPAYLPITFVSQLYHVVDLKKRIAQQAALLKSMARLSTGEWNPGVYRKQMGLGAFGCGWRQSREVERKDFALKARINRYHSTYRAEG